jgi:hypothetical protein
MKSRWQPGRTPIPQPPASEHLQVFTVRFHHSLRPSALGVFIFTAASILALGIISAAAQTTYTEARSVMSVSGQFTVVAATQYSPLMHQNSLATNANFIRLEPALLAVSAERFKAALWQQLGYKTDAKWNGKVFLALFPARSVRDPVSITITPLLPVWNYHVDLPDVVTRTRYARGLAAVLLLEIANRGNFDANHSAEIPHWLADGLGQLAPGDEPEKVMLSSPTETYKDVPQIRTDKKRRGYDPLIAARTALQNLPPLTYDQLCWPTGTQMDGDDGGAYLASAELFTSELLALKNGPEKMRLFLAKLPSCLNWQTAFFDTFRENFRRPLDVEKWWTLRLVRLAARDPGPRWNLATSRERMADLLSVPVELRAAPDALPEHATISLQAALQNFSETQRESVLRLKVRDFELAQFRMAAPFNGLADGYRAALTEFLGDKKKISRPSIAGRRGEVSTYKTGMTTALKKLEALDARRREAEAKLDTNPLPQH